MDTGFYIKDLSHQKLKNRIKKHEGFSVTPYKDQLGYLTIGFGHLILNSEKHLIKKKTKKEELEKIFTKDFNNALNKFNKFLKPFTLNKKDSDLLIEMVFQIGVVGVLNFKKLLYYMSKGDQNMVCFEMMNSLWYKQTPKRVKNLIKIILK